MSARGRGGRSRGHRTKDGSVALSKSLSQVLRHGALKEGLEVLPGGWVDLHSLLALPRFSMSTPDDVRAVVTSNDKQRFGLRQSPTDPTVIQIRANQGHSFAVDLEAEEFSLDRPESLPSSVIHGTYLKTWQESNMSTRGLSKMNRNEIHFSPGIPHEDSGVISGMRQSANVLVYVNLSKALSDGLKFYRSENNVILSPGDSEGFLSPRYFEKVVCRKTGHLLFSPPPPHDP